MNPETILIIAIVVLAAVAAYYGLRSRGSQPDEELYRLDVKLSSELKDELQGNFDDDEDLMLESRDDTTIHHVTRSLISDEEPEAFRPRDYYGMSAAKPQVAVEDKPVAEEELPEVEDAVEEAPLSEQPGIEGTLEFEEQKCAEGEDADSEEAPESIVEEEPVAETEPEPVAEEDAISEVEVEAVVAKEEVISEAIEEEAELPVSRASLPASPSQVVIEGPEEPEIEAEAKTEEEISEVEAEVTVEQAAEVETEEGTEVVEEPAAEIQEAVTAPTEAVIEPQSETILVKDEAPKPKGLFARFTGVVSKAEPVDLSDADDEFEAIDQPVDETSEASVLAELNPELAERLAVLNERLDGLGSIVNDLEETLSIFEEPELSDGSGSDESSRREDEQLAA